MPIYEYQCRQCDYSFDAIQRLGDTPLSECPQCQELKLKKRVSAPVFRLKGSGWYETDFKTGDKKNLVQSDNGSSDKEVKSTSDKASSDKTEAATRKPASPDKSTAATK